MGVVAGRAKRQSGGPRRSWSRQGRERILLLKKATTTTRRSDAFALGLESQVLFSYRPDPAASPSSQAAFGAALVQQCE